MDARQLYVAQFADEPGGPCDLKSRDDLIVDRIAYLRHRLRLLFGEMPVTASWFGPAGDFGGWRRTWGWDGGHLHLFTIPVVKRLLAEEGFVVEDCRDAGARYEAVRHLWPSLLYSNPTFFARRVAR